MKLNKYSGLSYEEFDRCLSECKSLWLANDKIYDILHAHANRYGEHAEFFMPLQSTSVIRLLSILLRDTEHWIDYWCYELNFGDYEDDGAVTDADGHNIPLHTTRQLWDFVVGNITTLEDD